MSRYIDADAMKDFFNNIQVELGAYRISFKAVNRAIDAMATVEPKRGEWIEDEQGKHKCSNCYAYAPLDGDEFWLRDKAREFLPNTCPYCDADMRKESE